jgi:hypothetical protein
VINLPVQFVNPSPVVVLKDHKHSNSQNDGSILDSTTYFIDDMLKNKIFIEALIWSVVMG